MQIETLEFLCASIELAIADEKNVHSSFESTKSTGALQKEKQAFTSVLHMQSK